jgi:chemotaxis protein CheD
LPEALSAGLGEALFGDDADVLLCAVGLGSCVALCLFDQLRRRAALAHVVLPSQFEEQDEGKSCTEGAWGQVHPQLWRAKGLVRYSNPAVEALLCKLGDGKPCQGVVAALVGGAQVLRVGPGMDIGKRNVKALRQALAERAIPVGLDDTGGKEARSVFLHASTGEVMVRTAGALMRSLGFLGKPDRPSQAKVFELPGLEGF